MSLEGTTAKRPRLSTSPHTSTSATTAPISSITIAFEKSTTSSSLMGSLDQVKLLDSVKVVDKHENDGTTLIEYTGITLTPREQELFEFLRKVLESRNLSTVLRVAGGWVRDKVLGLESHDIDIAVDDCSGKAFADSIVEYIKTIPPSPDTSHLSIGVIASNPEKSKHLETATMHLLDWQIDFAGLRNEEYAVESRIPLIANGTPLEDAMRRDLTVNALFYNINTGLIEDFTGKGVTDLKNGWITTPCDPKTTFLDDPLRVLRTFRFASRLRFTIDPKVLEAARAESTLIALKEKVSRERIGIELTGMLTGANCDPRRSLALICEGQLWRDVFRLEDEGLMWSERKEGDDIDTDVKPTQYIEEKCISSLCGQVIDIYASVIEKDEHRSRMLDVPGAGGGKATNVARVISVWLIPFLWPIRGLGYINSKDRFVSAASVIIKESLKLPMAVCDIVDTCHASGHDILQIITDYLANPNDPIDRATAGLWMRDCKDMWRMCLLSACAWLEVTEKISQGQCEHTFMQISHVFDSELGLDGCWTLQSILNGKQVIKALQLKRGGPLVGTLMKRMLIWQLRHPEGTVEECMEYIQNEYEAMATDTQ